jgi:hypothetical protein
MTARNADCVFFKKSKKCDAPEIGPVEPDPRRVVTTVDGRQHGLAERLAWRG